MPVITNNYVNRYLQASVCMYADLGMLEGDLVCATDDPYCHRLVEYVVGLGYCKLQLQCKRSLFICYL